MKLTVIRILTLVMAGLMAAAHLCAAATVTVTDGAGRQVTVDKEIRHIICSGPGCLRLITYLEAQDRVLAVDDMEKQRPKFDARPYALANPRFKALPIFGGFRGHDDPEKIMALSPLPQVIFKTFPAMGYDPEELQQKTGIPVVVLNIGSLTAGRDQLYGALTLAGRILGKEQRAEAVIGFFTDQITELEKRSKPAGETDMPACYVGGIAFKGPHGFASTEPGYPPFVFAGAKNLANTGDLAGKNMQHSQISREKIMAWDPPYLFLDLSTLQMGEGAGGLFELQTDPAYRTLTAVAEGKVYGLLPYNWYTQNFGSILADAWFVGKILHPGSFTDIDPVKKADEIYTFLVGAPVFDQMNHLFRSLVFQTVPVQETPDAF